MSNELPRLKAYEYKTIYTTSAGGLDEQVNQMLKEGWVPFGNPYRYMEGGVALAMVRRRRRVKA